MPPVRETTDEVDGVPVFWRSAPSEGAPVLYLHGVPTSSDDWVPFLERGGGLAVDLPGFGRSGKRADLDYTIAGYDRFLERFLAHAGVDRLSLVMHDWGAVGLAFAQRLPERVERLVVVNAVPFLEGYRWHRIARIWRTPVLGEIAMGATTRWSFRLGPMPRELADSAWAHFDQGTQRAILRLYRASPPDVLAAAGERLRAIAAPALVVWGGEDPYLPTAFADAYARRLGGAELEIVTGAGHWPWIDRPELVERIVEFAAG